MSHRYWTGVRKDKRHSWDGVSSGDLYKYREKIGRIYSENVDHVPKAGSPHWIKCSFVNLSQ